MFVGLDPRLSSCDTIIYSMTLFLFMVLVELALYEFSLAVDCIMGIFMIHYSVAELLKVSLS